ncbi:MAG: Bug family tripartite tricarboxylate transporter substrate binding protein [Hyphomicrobiaceae bacterium]
MTIKRREFIQGAVATSAATVFSPAVLRAAGNFPNGPVQLIVPFKPGGGSDRTFRLFAPYLAEALGKPVNIVNIAGGGGWVAWQQMARWSPDKDDHKLGTLNFPHVFSYLDPRMKRTETVDSFNFLAWQSLDPCVWAIRHDETRFTDLPSFLAYVDKNPGKITMSTTAVGSDDHMGIAFAEKFIPNFKVKKLYANGDSKKIQETISGVSDAVAGNVGYYAPYVNDKKLKFICTLHPERYNLTPDVPTFKEVTGKDNVSFAGRTIVCAPGMAAEKKAVYLAAIEKAITNPEYLAKEAKNKNNILFMKGGDISKKIEATKQYVESVRFWEQKT